MSYSVIVNLKNTVFPDLKDIISKDTCENKAKDLHM